MPMISRFGCWLRKIDWQQRLSDEVTELTRAVNGCHTVLDLGCGASSPVRFLQGRSRVGVDCFPESVTAAERDQTHERLVCVDVMAFLGSCNDGCFDVVVALDLIEHLTKEA